MSYGLFSLNTSLAQTQSSLTNVTNPTPSLGAQPASVQPQIADAVAQGGYVETEHSFATFAFVDGRLQIVGHSLDVTLIVPTHDHTGLKSSRVKEPHFVSDPNQPGSGGGTAQLTASLNSVDAQLAAAKANAPNSPVTLSLEAKDGAIRAAIAQVEITPGSYGTPPDVRGLLGNVTA